MLQELKKPSSEDSTDRSKKALPISRYRLKKQGPRVPKEDAQIPEVDNTETEQDIERRFAIFTQRKGILSLVVYIPQGTKIEKYFLPFVDAQIDGVSQSLQMATERLQAQLGVTLIGLEVAGQVKGNKRVKHPNLRVNFAVNYVGRLKLSLWEIGDHKYYPDTIPVENIDFKEFSLGDLRTLRKVFDLFHERGMSWELNQHMHNLLINELKAR